MDSSARSFLFKFAKLPRSSMKFPDNHNWDDFVYIWADFEGADDVWVKGC